MNNYVKYQQGDVLMLRINDSKCMMKDWHNCAEGNSNVKTITRKNVLDTNSHIHDKLRDLIIKKDIE